MHSSFSSLDVVHHGPILRYLALGLWKSTHRELSIRQSLRVSRIDDALPLPSKMGGAWPSSPLATRIVGIHRPIDLVRWAIPCAAAVTFDCKVSVTGARGRVGWLQFVAHVEELRAAEHPVHR